MFKLNFTKQDIFNHAVLYKRFSTTSYAVNWKYAKVDYDLNIFPDGQIQIKVPERLTSDHRLLISVSNSVMLDVLSQFRYGFFDDGEQKTFMYIDILYQYGSRCDKDDSRLSMTGAISGGVNTKVLFPHFNNVHLKGKVTRNLSKEKEVLNKVPFNCYDTLLFPDQTSYERFKPHLEQYGEGKAHVVCGKKRNQDTGEITDHVIPSVSGRVLVVDDLCDGGATFRNVARELDKDPNNLDLFVFHSIFSNKQNYHELSNAYGTIYTTNSYFGSHVQDHSLREYNFQPNTVIIDVWSM